MGYAKRWEQATMIQARFREMGAVAESRDDVEYVGVRFTAPNGSRLGSVTLLKTGGAGVFFSDPKMLEQVRSVVKEVLG